MVAGRHRIALHRLLRPAEDLGGRDAVRASGVPPRRRGWPRRRCSSNWMSTSAIAASCDRRRHRGSGDCANPWQACLIGSVYPSRENRPGCCATARAFESFAACSGDSDRQPEGAINGPASAIRKCSNPAGSAPSATGFRSHMPAAYAAAQGQGGTGRVHYLKRISSAVASRRTCGGPIGRPAVVPDPAAASGSLSSRRNGSGCGSCLRRFDQACERDPSRPPAAGRSSRGG